MIPVGFGASGSYSITNSVRLNGTSDYLSRTFSAGTSRQKMTISLWIKRGSLNTGTATYQDLFDAGTNVGGALNGFRLTGSSGSDAADKLQWLDSATSYGWNTTALYRDPGAWSHLLLAIDTTQATAAQRVRLYVNGVENTSLTTESYNGQPAQNTTLQAYGNNVTHRIGSYSWTGGSYYNGSIAEFYYIDGQQLTPTSFGKTDSNGVWVPIKYAGTYGTNGFKLEFKSSGVLGTDTSGNGNNWTVSGSPVQTVDTPTNNYATWNPLRPSTSSLSVGNTTAAGTASGTVPVSQSDTWYWEIKANAVGVTAGLENTSGTTYTQSVTNGATTGFRYTHSATTLEYTTNGSTWNTISSAVSGVAFPYATGASNTANFGTTAFAYTPPTGFKALCTANLPSVAVTTSGTFTGNANADGQFVWTNGNPATLTINGNAVTFGTHADKTAGGFKLRTSSASYNTSGSNTWTATAGKRFVYSATSINTAQGNP